MQKQQSRSKNIQVHDYDLRLERIWRRLEKDILKENIRLLKKYDNAMVNEALAKPTRLKHLEISLNLCRMLNKDWINVTKDDIDNLVTNIMKIYGSDNGQETNTIWDHKKVLKIFFRWLKPDSRNFRDVGDPPETKHIKVKKVKDKLIREDLLNEADINMILKACGENQLDRALLACHAEAGTRPSEILNLKIKHVKFDDYGAVIHVDGKTGARTIRLIVSTPELAKWIDVHPFKDNVESPLWIMLEKGKEKEPLSYAAARKLLARRCRIAGISKHVNLNLFRHSAATLTANFLTESQLRNRHGWTPSSKIPARYVHMVSADVDQELFEHYGMKKKENLEKTPQRSVKFALFQILHNQ